eukprot:9416844-Pyramimonas_sp.AAC.1
MAWELVVERGSRALAPLSPGTGTIYFCDIQHGELWACFPPPPPKVGGGLEEEKEEEEEED